MSEIIIKITISEDEYKNWYNFEVGDVDILKKNLSKDFREVCNDLGIDECEIEVTTQ